MKDMTLLVIYDIYILSYMISKRIELSFDSEMKGLEFLL